MRLFRMSMDLPPFPATSVVAVSVASDDQMRLQLSSLFAALQRPIEVSQAHTNYSDLSEKLCQTIALSLIERVAYRNMNIRSSLTVLNAHVPGSSSQIFSAVLLISFTRISNL